MSFATINQAANDQQLRARVDAAAQKVARTDPTYGDTAYGKQLISGTGTGGAMPAGVTLLPSPLMWGVAVDTEALYEAALLDGNGSPGHDAAVISDEVITQAVQNHWPPDPEGSTLNTSMMPLASAVPQPTPPPPLSPEEEALRMQAPGNGNDEPAS
jgi:hypothetical protein